MIFKNIDFHNVSELTLDDKGGYIMHRLPVSVEEQMAPNGAAASKVTSGVELRFKLISSSARLRLRLDTPEGSATLVHIYRGGIIGGWQESSIYIVGGDTKEIIINKRSDADKLRKITDSARFPFSPEVIRVVLNSSSLRFVSVDGELQPPNAEDLPKKTYLAYGSSITHGSTSLVMPYSFASLIGQHFCADVRNLGIAGNARLEPAVADEIAAMGERGEWDFATLCMGINILNIECEDFEARVKNMINTIAGRNPEKEIFCISPFYCNEDMNGSDKPGLFREIIARSVMEYDSSHVHYIDGSKILNGPWGLSGDFVHPSPLGVSAIAKGLIKIMKEFIK